MTYEGIRPFEPMPGRIMKEYVAIPEPLYRNKELFTELFVSEIDTVRVVITTKGKGEEEDEKEVAFQKICTAAPTVYALRLFACKNG